MKTKIEFKDHSDEVKKMAESLAIAWLHEAAGELQAQVKKNTAVDHSDTKKSWDYAVDNDKLEANIGSSFENAIWEEFGTGEYALNGDGRKTPWYVPVEEYTGKKKPTYNGKVVIVYGKNGVKYYKTNGKKPKRAFHNAYTRLKPKLIKKAQSMFNKGLK